MNTAIPTPSITSNVRLRKLPDSLAQSVQYILSVQMSNGAIPWFSGGKLDPWDHVESAMALSVGGYFTQAISAYEWLKQNQLTDGSWLANYYLSEEHEPNSMRQSHFVAYIATGVWHHYLVSGNVGFLKRFFPCVERAIDCVLRFQSCEGEIAWAFDEHGKAHEDALLTGCCSILRSLDCALRIALELKQDKPHWANALVHLSETIRCKSYRFDRTWESKARFSMDWYYPILSGALNREASQQRMKARWDEFIVADLGCKCVCDEPWITVAESSELVMAMVAAGQKAQAAILLNQLEQWRDKSDGGYWTGYVYRDKAIWPEEKTTWTAAAVILAADAVHGYSGAAQIFSREILTPIYIKSVWERYL